MVKKTKHCKFEKQVFAWPSCLANITCNQMAFIHTVPKEKLASVASFVFSVHVIRKN